MLCLGSICLGFVLHNYWEYGGRALQSTLASEEFQEDAKMMFTSCRSVELSKESYDAALYKMILSQPNLNLDDSLIEAVSIRYKEIIERTQRGLIIFSNVNDLEDAGRPSTERLVDDSSELIKTHNQQLHRTP